MKRRELGRRDLLSGAAAGFVGASVPAAAQTPGDALSSGDALARIGFSAGPGAITRSVQAKLADILHAKDFGAVGDGAADDTAALVNLLAAMQTQGKPGMLGGGGEETRYLIECGALKWTFDNRPTVDPPGVAGPTLYTAGRVILKAKSGSANSPFLSIHNDPDPAAGSRYIHGGYIGPLIFSDTTGDVGTSRHGIELYGVQNMTFAPMFSAALKGDLIRITAQGRILTGDGWHVSNCRFEGLSTQGTQGWALNNDSLNQFFNFNHIGYILAIGSAKGAWRGPGACNQADRVNAAWCGGWGVDWTPDENHVQGATIGTLELDAPEFGIRINGVMGGNIGVMRISHRHGELGGQIADRDHCWPKIAIQLGNDGSRQVSNIGMRAVHLLRASITAANDHQLGIMVDLGNNAQLVDVEIRNTIAIQGRGANILPARYLANVHPGAIAFISVDGRPLLQTSRGPAGS